MPSWAAWLALPRCVALARLRTRGAGLASRAWLGMGKLLYALVRKYYWLRCLAASLAFVAIKKQEERERKKQRKEKGKKKEKGKGKKEKKQEKVSGRFPFSIGPGLLQVRRRCCTAP